MIILENLIYISIGLLMALAILCVYAMIQLGRNNTLTFLLIPLVLISAIFTGYSIFALQGTPIPGIPKGQVEVIWAEVQKPSIFFLVRVPGNSTRPIYHSIPYTEDNAANGNGQKGEFKIEDKDGNDLSRTDEIFFDNISRSKLPMKKSQMLREGVDSVFINEIHNSGQWQFNLIKIINPCNIRVFLWLFLHLEVDTHCIMLYISTIS